MWSYSGIESSNKRSVPVLLTTNKPCSLPYDRSTDFHKASSLHSAIQCFFFQSPVSIHLIKIIQQVLTFTSFSFHHFFPTLSHHPVSASIFVFVFLSLLPYPFPIIQQLLTSSSFSSRYFFPTPFPSYSRCLRLLPCLSFTSSLPLSHHPVDA